MNQHKQETEEEDDECPYDHRDYNDGPPTEEEIKAFWIDPEKYAAACEEFFERYKQVISLGKPGPQKPAGKPNALVYRPGRQMSFRS